jgi:hypothetical protein
VRQTRGNIWDFHAAGHWIVVPTNGTLRRNVAVMGKGLAREAAQRFPDLPYALGEQMRDDPYRVYAFPNRIIALPTKFDWWDRLADPGLIVAGCRSLATMACPDQGIHPPVYIPCLGCGQGGLSWTYVRDLIAPILDNRFVVVYH